MSISKMIKKRQELELAQLEVTILFFLSKSVYIDTQHSA